VRLLAHHRNRYFLFEVDGPRDDDPWAPYGRVYDRLARVLFDRVPLCRLADLDDFLEPWKGSDRERESLEAEAGGSAA
jgi:hypothetical protein